MCSYFYLRSLVVETRKFEFTNRAKVFLCMKVLCVLNMAMFIIRVHNIMNILNGIKPQEYPEEK